MRRLARAHEVAGDRYFEQGQVREAGKEYFEVVRLAPRTPGAHIALGQTLAAVGNWSAAITEFKAETQLRPDNAEAFYRLGSALLQQNQNPEALTVLTRADTLGPDTPAVLLALGQAAQSPETPLAPKNHGRGFSKFRSRETLPRRHIHIWRLFTGSREKRTTRTGRRKSTRKRKARSSRCAQPAPDTR